MKAALKGRNTTTSLLSVIGVALVGLLSGAIIYGQMIGGSGSGSSITSASSVASSSVSSTPEPTLMITGKVAIVLCKEPAIINASQCKGPPDMYSSRQLVLTTAFDISYNLQLNSDGSFTGQVPAATYQISITSCDFLGCNLPKPITIAVAADQDRNYSICFNC